MSDQGKAKSRLIYILKAIGYLTSPDTKPGKVFIFWERNMTRIMERLATNELYLNMAGKMMERSFQMQAKSIENMEQMLHLMRMPSYSDVIDVREKAHHLQDQMEALTAQMAVLLDKLEALEKSRESSPSQTPAA